MARVKLRRKPISGGKERLILDYYPPILNPETGKYTRWEVLDLCLFSEIAMKEATYINKKGKEAIRFVPILDKHSIPKKAKLSPTEKQFNKETLDVANNVCAKRQVEIQNLKYEFLPNSKLKLDFLIYFEELAEKRKDGNKGSWLCALHYLKDFSGGKISFADINKKYCNDFREYILKAPRIRSPKRTISQNSAQSYFNKLKAALKQAFRDGLIKTDLGYQLERIKDGDTERKYLTLDELNSLVQTECSIPILKQAALFSALTGLRFSDIQKLVWGEVQQDKDEKGEKIYSLHFIQQKTKGSQVLPISQQAYELLGSRGEHTEKVFDGLSYSAFINFHLKRWILNAGITKNITFHCFRHTFATLQLSYGTDLFTISKLLGHRDIQTTQIYVKSMDMDKRKAANRIKLDFHS